MVKVKPTASQGRITVRSNNDTTIFGIKDNLSEYYAKLSERWANSLDMVNGIDYSSKYYAEQSKTSAQVSNEAKIITKELIEGFENVVTNNTNNIIETGNDYRNQITETKNAGIEEITTAKAEAVENVESVGADVIADIQENGKSLPMFTSIWIDHIYNDASYLRADTFSWQNADIYVTGYEILENEYNNENCVTETENGIEYRLSPNGFKIADVSQSDAILNLYESGKNAWFYIIDTENRKFKLPREKSNEHKYLYFYVGNYSRPDTEINLGILAELANSQDLESVLASIVEVKDNGIAELEATTASGISNITTIANTGVNNINNATTAGVKTINDTTNAGKTAIQQIVNAGVPLATLETAGIVRPDGETITIVDGIISSAGGGGGDWEVLKGTNSGYLKHTESGMIIQWGKATAKKNTKTTVTFSIPFTTTNISVVISQNPTSNLQTDSINITSITTTNVTFNVGLGVDFTVWYIAIGY